MRSIHHSLTVVLALACATTFTPAAHAQLAIEARGGITQPASGMDVDASTEGGYATEVSVTVSALPFVGLYGAWQKAQFDRENGGDESVITDEGWAGGVRVSVPTPFIPIDPWIRAGVVSHELEAGGLTRGGARGVGVEVGGGLRFRLGRAVSLTPGVNWTRYSFDDDAVTDGKVNVEHLRVDVGVRFGF
jgi:hypothetical protein